MSLNQFLVILRARWQIAVVTFLAVVLLVTFTSLIWPKQYTATASIVIDSKSDPVAANGAGGGGMTAQPQATYVNTQADIIASQRVAQRVVRTLKLDQQPEARKLWAKGTGDDISVTIANLLLEKKLNVAPAHDSPTHASNVIDISVQWSDPVTAAALANGFAQAAIETNIELKVEPAKQYATWFDQRSHALRADLEAKQKLLSDFQSAKNENRCDRRKTRRRTCAPGRTFNGVGHHPGAAAGQPITPAPGRCRHQFVARGAAKSGSPVAQSRAGAG